MAISKFNYNSFNVTPVAGNALSFNSDADGFSTAGASSMTLIKTITASNDANASFHHGTSDRKSTRLNSSHSQQSRMPSSA